MKKLSLIALVAALLCFSFTARAQYGGIVSSTVTNFILFTGTTNANALVTNTVTVTAPSKYIVLTNVVNTNQVFTGSVYMQIPQNLLTNFTGFSNLVLIGSISQTFTTGLPSGGIWSTTTPPVSGSVSFPLILQANNGIYTNGIFAQ